MISGNKENGIFCTGPENYTKIESNSFIGYNKKAGLLENILI
jgi:F-box protein 11